MSKEKKKRLVRQVEMLQNKLEQVKQEVAADKVTNNFTEVNEGNVELENTTEDNLQKNLRKLLQKKPVEALENDVDKVLDATVENDEVAAEYDVILQVKPEKISQIKSQIIDGKKCIVIPINEDEQTNG